MTMQKMPWRIPESEWPQLLCKLGTGPDYLHKPPKQPQGLQKQCGPSVVAWCVELMREKEMWPYVDLSAADLFSRSGPDQDGTNLGTVIDVAMNVGIGLTAFSGEVYAPGMIPTPEEYCELFKSTWYDCSNDFGLAMSSVLMEYPLAISINWKLGYRVDKAGWLNMANTQTQSGYGHVIAGYKPAVRMNPLTRVIEYGIWCWNSIGSFSPGTDSCVAIPMSKFQTDNSIYASCQNVAG